MIIRQWQDVIDKRKTQTRRVIDIHKTRYIRTTGSTVFVPPIYRGVRLDGLSRIEVQGKDGKWRVKWQVGKVYAMVPKMGKPGVGFYRITALSAECLQDITEADAIAEGILPFVQIDMSMGYTCRGIDAAYPTARACYRALWESMGTRWNDDQYVVVIGIEYVGAERPCTTH